MRYSEFAFVGKGVDEAFHPYLNYVYAYSIMQRSV